MYREFLKSKIHRATVTDIKLSYEGSLTLDPVLMNAAQIDVFEKVLVVNVNNGERFETYVIEGERHSGEVCVNGAAARLAQPGDLVIIITFCLLDANASKSHAPLAVQVDTDNRIKSRGH